MKQVAVVEFNGDWEEWAIMECLKLIEDFDFRPNQGIRIAALTEKGSGEVLEAITPSFKRTDWMIPISNIEIKKLRDYFDTNGVGYEVMDWVADEFNIHIDLKDSMLSFTTSEESYGGYQGLIEFYNFRDEPTGHLTADEAIEIYEREVAE